MNTPNPRGATVTVPRQRQRIWLGAAILAIVVLVFALVIAAPNPQAGSTYSRGLTGYRQWFDYMQPNSPIDRWRQNYDQLSGTGQTLIHINPQPFKQPIADPSDLSSYREGEVLRPWVEQGNTLLLLVWNGKVTPSSFASELRPTEAFKSLAEINDSPALRVRVETTRRRPKLKSSNTSLLRDAYGTVVWSRTVGEGHVILCTYPWLGANALGEYPDNYRFLATLAQQQPGKIWVDEWVHGYRDPSPAEAAEDQPPQSIWEYLASTPVILLLGQIALILVLLIWGHNHRFGALLTPQPPTLNASQQYIQALATTLNASRHTGFVMAHLARELGERLSTRLGIPVPSGPAASLDLERLAHHWSQQTGRPPAVLLKILRPLQDPIDDGSAAHRPHDPALLAWIIEVESVLKDFP